MWLFTEADGFISAVVHRDDPSQIMVRARDADHLRRYFPGHPIQTTPDADYRYRLTLPREELAELVADRIRTMQATNFKAETARHFDGVYLDALHEVWAVMWRYQNHG
ncbi:hypothetical protein [Primorskyibacter sp. S87]|uniref:hypothetical protein n=1 Tax=Primorskyibacter sp. S87 TaxID=3415126 RepID=UPI003C7EA5A4